MLVHGPCPLWSMMVHNGPWSLYKLVHADPWSWSMLDRGRGQWWFVAPVQGRGSCWSMILVHPGGGVDLGTRELRLYLSEVRQMFFSFSHFSADYLFPSSP